MDEYPIASSGNNDKKLDLWKQPYSCPQCILSPELLSINKASGTIKIKCKNHNEQEIPIAKSITELTKNNNYNAKCMLCKEKNNNNFSNAELKYCLECKKIICKTCLNKHENHENKNNIIINLQDVNSKCHIHMQPFCFYCYDCNKSVCHICISKKEHNFHRKELLNELIQPEINEKEIDNINKAFKEEKQYLLKRVEELDGLIKLNDMIINSYKNDQNNFNYIMNIKNILLKNVFKEYKLDILKKKNLDKFNKVNDTFISSNSKYLNYENQLYLYPRKFSKFCELRLSKVKYLNLAETKISDLSSFKNFCFDSMEVLNLKNNLIKKLDPLEGLNIPNLLELNLSSNYIKNIKSLGNINYPKLKILNLESNKIVYINILSKDIFSNLTKLILSRNKISDINVLSNVKFKELTYLDLGSNKISDLNSFEKAPFKKLKRLFLNNNKIKSETLSNLSFDDLRILNLSENSIQDCLFLKKAKINNLKILNLNSNEINDIENIANYNFKNLIELVLSRIKMKNIGCLNKDDFERLKYQYLDENKILNEKKEEKQDKDEKKNDEVIHFNNKIELNRQFEQQDEEIINVNFNIDINEPPPFELKQIQEIRQFEQQDEEIINEKHNIDINEPPPIEFNQIPKINELRKSDDNNMIFKQPKDEIVNSSKNFRRKPYSGKKKCSAKRKDIKDSEDKDE